MTQRLSRITTFAALVLGCSLTLQAKGTTFTLLHLNDSHSHLDAGGAKDHDLNGTSGGLARAATVIAEARASEPNVLVLHGGDIFQGDPLFNRYFGVPELQILMALGVDAMAVGNHEFDLGPAVLRDALATAFAAGSMPVLSANLDLSAFPDLLTWIAPSTLKTLDGVGVGIFGLTVPDDPTMQPAPVVVRDNIVPIAQQTVNDLRAAGADVVIALSHLGLKRDEAMVGQVRGIDIVVGAHDHLELKKPVWVRDPDGNSIPILQAGSFYRNIGSLRFTWDKGHLSFGKYKLLPLGKSVKPAPDVQAMVEALKLGVVGQFGDLYHTVVGSSKHDLDARFDPKTPWRDTPLGNVVTDAYRTVTDTDIGIAALGLISEGILAGPIVGADVFKSLSYGYDIPTGFGLKLATMDISGLELLKGMEITLSQLESGINFFLQVSGMAYAYDPTRPVGQRVILESLRIRGAPWDPTATYSMTVNTGIAALLGQLGIAVQNLVLRDELEYMVVRDGIAAQSPLNARPEGRIVEVRPARPTRPLRSTP